MKAIAYFIAVAAAFALHDSVNAAAVQLVTVGSPGNLGDPLSVDSVHLVPVGSVPYFYRIGKTEITNAQYTDFLNAVATSDPYELYHSDMGALSWGGIVRSGTPGSYAYAVKAPAIGQGPGATDYAYNNTPVVYVSWFDAIRFANWMHNGQGSGGTENGAYTLMGGTPVPSNAESITRNAGAQWWLPSEDESYKAAYFNPSTNSYLTYPTGTNDGPNNNLPSADTGNSANFTTTTTTTGKFGYPFTDAGAYTLSASPFGTFDQGGSVTEWNERITQPGIRIVRGGSWFTQGDKTSRFEWSNGLVPNQHNFAIGFRVAAVIPEPGAATLVGLLCVTLLAGRRIRTQ